VWVLFPPWCLLALPFDSESQTLTNGRGKSRLWSDASPSRSSCRTSSWLDRRPNCRSGKTNICITIRDQQNAGHLPDGTARLSRDGAELRHFMGCSTFAEATVMSEISLAKINAAAPMEAASLFACGLSTGLVKGREQVPGRVERYLAGDIDVDAFVSHRITLDEVNKGFDLMHHQDGIRSVIQFA
jgi:Zn-dependent alcohol dehydrogenase